ncbi:MAG: hypothetical protein MUC50_19805 [Myxococcota bacterium]|jgi:hypothetical protein|nr:hypothetical protein [Myxococcota bacterium]
MLSVHVRALVLSSLFVGLSVFFFHGSASAGNASKAATGKALAGKVVILTNAPPPIFSNDKELTLFIRKNSTKKVEQTTDGIWQFETMAFFKSPLDDFEVEMVFYDITEGNSVDSRRFVNSYTQYTRNRASVTLVGKNKLIPPDFRADRSYLIIVKSMGAEIARGEFSTLGMSEAQANGESPAGQK